MSVEIAEGLVLPDSVAAEVWAFLGRRGSGKTYAAGRLIEQLADGGFQVVIVDPVGTHWGLRLAKDGKAAGIAIPVFGGQHGDIALQPGAGAVVARLIAEQRVSLVLDVSEFSGAEQRRFVADFATELLQIKKRHKSALMVVWEEAQEFAPQRAGADVARMLGAVEKLIKLGRNFGIGTALVTQRPQAVNKDVLNQAEFLVALQMTGPQERKTIDGWVQEKGADRAIGNELPSLPVGEALIWGPRLGVFGRYRILPKRTYDASSTPGAAPVRATELAAIDLEAVSAAMAETIEKAKADDPKELRRQLAELRKERDQWMAAAERAVAAAEKSTEGWMEASEVEAFLARRMTINAAKLGAARTAIEEAATLLNEWLTSDADFDESPDAGAIELPTPSGAVAREPRGESRTRSTAQVSREPISVATPAPPKPPRSEGKGTSLSKAERAVLSVLAQYPAGRTKRQVAMLTGYSGNGGGFNNAISALRTRGYLVGTQANLQATRAGLESGIEWEPLPTGRALLDHWLAQCSKAERAILEVLTSAYPNSLTKAELGERTGYEPTGGGFNNALSRLRTLELIERGAEPRAADDLMESLR